MSTAANSRTSSALITWPGEATPAMAKPSPFRSRRSASRTSGWSSAMRIAGTSGFGARAAVELLIAARLARLLVAQGGHGVEAGRAPGGEEAGPARHRQEQQ